jgi:PHP family Zn ribbon phosphoesterase
MSDETTTCSRCWMRFIIGEKPSARAEGLRCPVCQRAFWAAEISQYNADGGHSGSLIRCGVESR